MYSKTNDWLNLIILFLIVFIAAYLLGINILNLIDRKMTDISINMPKINLSPPKVILKMDPKNNESNEQKQNKEQKGGAIDPLTTSVSASEVTTVPSLPLPVPSLPVEVDSPQQATPTATVLATQPVSVAPIVDTRAAVVATRAAVVATRAAVVATSSNPQQNYYKDPSEMTIRQKEKFKLYGQISKMSLQDYINWLSLFQNDITTLAARFPANLPNFEKYLRGETITIEDLNRVKMSPLSRNNPQWVRWTDQGVTQLAINEAPTWEEPFENFAKCCGGPNRYY